VGGGAAVDNGPKQQRAVTLADRCVPWGFKLIQIAFKLGSIQIGPSQDQKISDKIWLRGFDVRNIFPYRNFFRFKIEFELKFRESSRV
jgi:hypothetical protein